MPREGASLLAFAGAGCRQGEQGYVLVHGRRWRSAGRRAPEQRRLEPAARVAGALIHQVPVTVERDLHGRVPELFRSDVEARSGL